MSVVHVIKVAGDITSVHKDENRGWDRFKNGLEAIERASQCFYGLGRERNPQIPPRYAGSTVLVPGGELAGCAVIQERERVLVVAGSREQRDLILDRLSVKDNPYVLHDEEIVSA